MVPASVVGGDGSCLLVNVGQGLAPTVPARWRWWMERPLCWSESLSKSLARMHCPTTFRDEGRGWSPLLFKTRRDVNSFLFLNPEEKWREMGGFAARPRVGSAVEGDCGRNECHLSRPRSHAESPASPGSGAEEGGRRGPPGRSRCGKFSRFDGGFTAASRSGRSSGSRATPAAPSAAGSRVRGGRPGSGRPGARRGAGAAGGAAPAPGPETPEAGESQARLWPPRPGSGLGGSPNTEAMGCGCPRSTRSGSARASTSPRLAAPLGDAPLRVPP